MRESSVEKAIGDYARKHNFLTYKFTSPQHRGVPDRIFISPKGVVIFIEIKAPGKVPTALQYREIKKLLAQGVPAFFCDNYAAGVIILDAYR